MDSTPHNFAFSEIKSPDVANFCSRPAFLVKNETASGKTAS